MSTTKAQAALAQGLQHLRAGNLAEAERAFEKVLRLDKRNFGALNLLAVVLMQGQRFAEAERHLKAAHVINPNEVPTLSNYALALRELGRADEALALLERAVALAPTDAEVWHTLGAALS